MSANERDDDAPKIIIDSDWKEDAAKEKEKIAQEAEEHAGTGEIPEPSVVELINMIVMQASIAIGGYRAPTGETHPPDLAVAKHYIDLLDLLREKTAGNVTDDEAKIFEGVLHELRMQYVQAATPGATPPPPGSAPS